MQNKEHFDTCYNFQNKRQILLHYWLNQLYKVCSAFAHSTKQIQETNVHLINLNYKQQSPSHYTIESVFWVSAADKASILYNEL